MRRTHYFNKTQAAHMFGVDERTITRWQNDATDPLPAIRDGAGKPNRYDPAAIHAWGIRRALARCHVGDDGHVYDFEKERARLTHEQADKAALENAQLRGELIAAEVLRHTLVESFADVRRRLLELPAEHGELLRDAESLDELRTRFTGVVESALQELASSELPPEALKRIEAVAIAAEENRETT